MNEVCIAWASRKRHIFVDGKLICDTLHKPDYSKGGHYCSYTLSGLPTHIKQPDTDYKNGGGAHLDGIIPFKPLSEIVGISERSICKKCLTKYKKLFVAVLIFFLPLLSIGQRIEIPKFKSYVPAGVFVFLAGATDGLRDASMYRMDGYGKFWNGKQSFANKYKNGDMKQGAAYFGSTSFLVWTTDAAHLSNMFTHQFNGMALAYMPYDENKKFFHVFLKVAAYNAVRQLGHSIVYDVIFKPKK